MKTAALTFVVSVLVVSLCGWTSAVDTRNDFYGNMSFIRGDANIDGTVNIADMVDSLGFLFGVRGHENPHCLAAHDANDDGTVDISDAIYTANYLFGGGRMPPPPKPFPDCGVDPTELRGGYLPCDDFYICVRTTR